MAIRKSLVGAIFLSLLCLLGSCKPGPGSSPQISEAATAKAQAAPWLNQLIQQLQQEEAANPPAKIYRYKYNNQEVYYLTGRCCAIPGNVYDVHGTLLCEADGGIMGKGDGRCTDFLSAHTNETLIWEDKREQ